MRKLIEQIMKFGVVGVIAFVIDFGVMVFLTEVFGIDPVISATVSFIISVIFNYAASMRYVFSHREGMSRTREFIIFVVLSAIGLGINELMMWGGTSWLAGLMEQNAKLSSLSRYAYMIVKIFATAVVMVYNFITRKIFLEGEES